MGVTLKFSNKDGKNSWEVNGNPKYLHLILVS